MPFEGLQSKANCLDTQCLLHGSCQCKTICELKVTEFWPFPKQSDTKMRNSLDSNRGRSQGIAGAKKGMNSCPWRAVLEEHLWKLLDCIHAVQAIPHLSRLHFVTLITACSSQPVPAFGIFHASLYLQFLWACHAFCPHCFRCSQYI